MPSMSVPTTRRPAAAYSNSLRGELDGLEVGVLAPERQQSHACLAERLLDPARVDPAPELHEVAQPVLADQVVQLLAAHAVAEDAHRDVLTAVPEHPEGPDHDVELVPRGQRADEDEVGADVGLGPRSRSVGRCAVGDDQDPARAPFLAVAPEPRGHGDRDVAEPELQPEAEVRDARHERRPEVGEHLLPDRPVHLEDHPPRHQTRCEQPDAEDRLPRHPHVEASAPSAATRSHAPPGSARRPARARAAAGGPQARQLTAQRLGPDAGLRGQEVRDLDPEVAERVGQADEVGLSPPGPTNNEAS